MSKDSEQEIDEQDESNAGPPTSKGLNLGPLCNLNQVTKGLAKTIRAMADGSIDSQVGARICNGLALRLIIWPDGSRRLRLRALIGNLQTCQRPSCENTFSGN